MAKEHFYSFQLVWTGNTGENTANYKAYERAFVIKGEGKEELLGSSDPAFRGDPTKWNPEELLLASLSSCHMLWYLHLAAESGIQVVEYKDDPKALLSLEAGGKGFVSKIILNPRVTITDLAQSEKANALHQKAHEMCFIANSIKSPVEIHPKIEISPS